MLAPRAASERTHCHRCQKHTDSPGLVGGPRELEVAGIPSSFFGRGSLYQWRTLRFVESEWALRLEIAHVGSGKPLEALSDGTLRHCVAEKKRPELLAPQVGDLRRGPSCSLRESLSVKAA